MPATSPTELFADAQDVDALRQRMARLHESLVHTRLGGIETGQRLAAAADALTKRLVCLGVAQLGPTPTRYCWVATGSQARGEMNFHSDQDNALILSDPVSPQDDAYFSALAGFVSTGLNHCGIRFCPGEVMASTASWRQPASRWRAQFEHWLTGADRKRAMLAANFLDMRTNAGDDDLCQALRAHILPIARRQESFLAHLIHNALDNRPPLGFFGDITVSASGTIDLKKSLLIPIVDIARIAAVGAGIDAVATLDRLRGSAGTPWLSHDAATELANAFTLGCMLRTRHQNERALHRQQPDNLIAPATLSPAERDHLRRALSEIVDVQDVLHARLSLLPL